MFRLKDFVEENKIKQRELCQLLNVSQAYMSHMINGKLPFSEDKVNTLRNKYGVENVDRFISDGEYIQVESSGIKLLPLMPISAQGGSLNDFVISVQSKDCEKIISPIRDADIAISVSGDSMAPEYPNGCKVLAKKIDERAFIDWGKAYVLDTRNGVVIKLLAPSDKENCVRCVSINPSPIYAPFDISFEDIFGIYVVQMCMCLK